MDGLQDSRRARILYRDFSKLFSLLSLFRSSCFTKMIKGEGERGSHESNSNNDLFHEKKKLKTTDIRLLDQNYILSGKDFTNK